VTGVDLPLHTELFGPAPAPDLETFVLIHGYGASGFTWRHWSPRLARLGHVVQIDLKGFGRAPKPDDSRYAPGDQAELVRRLIVDRDLSNVTLVGHSLGGGVALLAAMGLMEEARSRLRRLVLVAGAAYAQRLPPFVKMAAWPRLSALLFELVSARRVVEGALRMVVFDSDSVTADQVKGYADPLGSPGAVRVLLSTARQIVPPDLPSVVGRYPLIPVPSLLLWGRDDPVVPLSVGQRLARALPNARLHVLERCGHLAQEERPAESFAVLERFLRET
jgi:pimeloyl-ACP methyl ester carboxylesterase